EAAADWLGRRIPDRIFSVALGVFCGPGAVCGRSSASDQSLCAAWVDPTGPGDREHYLVPRAAHHRDDAACDSGNSPLVLSVLRVPQEFRGTVCSESTELNFRRKQN